MRCMGFIYYLNFGNYFMFQFNKFNYVINQQIANYCRDKLIGCHIIIIIISHSCCI